jgi:metal-responsive CopG/Arc/MetJ family transcriptional regulator
MKVGISVSLEIDLINRIDNKVRELNNKEGSNKLSRSLYIEDLITKDLATTKEVKPENKKSK